VTRQVASVILEGDGSMLTLFGANI